MRIDKPASIVSVFAYRPLEVAVETATINLIDWLVPDHGFTADRRVLPRQHVPGLPDQRVSDVQDPRVSATSPGPSCRSAISPSRGMPPTPPGPIGASPRRKEDAPLLEGRGRYLDDLRRPGTAHLGVVRSPHAHARVRRIDADAGARDARRLRSSPPPISPSSRTASRRRSGGRRTRVRTSSRAGPEVVRYVGEPVAVVVADDPYRLADAMDAVIVDYEPLPPVTTLDAAARGAERVHADWPDNAAVVARGGDRRGRARACRGRPGRRGAPPPPAHHGGPDRAPRRPRLPGPRVRAPRRLVVDAESLPRARRRGRGPRAPGREGPRPRPRRGRRLRPEGLRLPRGAAGPGRRAPPRAAREVGGGPPRALRRHRPRPRAGPRGADRLPAGRDHRRRRRRVPGRRGRLPHRGRPGSPSTP